jgi:hypothetical protein
VGIKIDYIRMHDGAGEKKNVGEDRENFVQGYCVLVRK